MNRTQRGIDIQEHTPMVLDDKTQKGVKNAGQLSWLEKSGSFFPPGREFLTQKSFVRD
jgi:hypothetical protein